MSHYGLVEHYAILKANNTDVSPKQWTQPVYREILKCRRRIARAKEEITRCNVEVRRLHTGIHDDALHFKKVVRKLKEEENPMYEAVKTFARRRNATHKALLKKIRKIYSLPGFTGDPSLGVRIGHDVGVDVDSVEGLEDDETNGNDILNATTTDNGGNNNADNDDDNEAEEAEEAESDDEFQYEVKTVVDYVCTSRD